MTVAMQPEPILSFGILRLALFDGGFDFGLAAIVIAVASTAGGIKVNPIVFAVQLLVSEVHRVIRPNRVDTIRLATVAPHPTNASGAAFLLMYILLLGLGRSCCKPPSMGRTTVIFRPAHCRAVHVDEY